MLRELPPFQPVTLAELRRLYARHPDPDVKRLVLEIVRYRRSMKEIDDCYKTIQAAWHETSNGNLVALHLLHGIMNEERFRTPS
jgi:hypothetical protein